MIDNELKYESSKLDLCLGDHISNIQESERLTRQITDLQNKQIELVRINKDHERTLAKRIGAKGAFTITHVIFAKQNCSNGIYDTLEIRDIAK